MTVNEQKAAAKAFVETWKDKGYEKGESLKPSLIKQNNSQARIYLHA